ncbi:MAG: F0F1 ATP synthase subunit epsilon [Desulfobulbaceae bacterium]|nr:F0F1 ATP synthase subunit epsilon [Desulfobulbaceae bacterium]
MGNMHLKILLPTEVLLHEEIRQVTAESPSGEFCLKPRHIDFVTALVPGVLVYLDQDKAEHFVAVDGGILIKQQEEVSVAARHAVPGELGELERVVRKMQEDFIEREKIGRTAAARLEIGFFRRFLDISGR